MKWFNQTTDNQKCKKTKRFLLMIIFIIFAYVYFRLFTHVKVPFTKDYLGTGDDFFLAMKRMILQDREDDDNQLACKQPDLPLFAPDMMRFVKNVNLSCYRGPKFWVQCKMSNCSIRKDLVLKHGKNIYCNFTDLIRKSDFFSRKTRTTNFVQSYILKESDHVDVKCVIKLKKTKVNGTAKQQRWEKVLPGIRKSDEIQNRTGWQYVPENSLNLSILMIGFDSLSRNHFRRKLPQTYNYLVNDLEAVVLEGYNVVGDGTPEALIPMLTGKTELELPFTQKWRRWATTVDVYPWVWNTFRNVGYVTGYFEDLPQSGIFTLRLKGFREAPTDHYLRAFYVESQRLYSSQRFCDGPVPRHRVHFSQIRNFMYAYKDKPKFLFSFHGELSHDDYNLIQTADLDLKNLIYDLKNASLLDDTILIVMADHGPRFGMHRSSFQGKLEQNMPFFSIVMPKRFREKRPKLYDALLENANRLTTPFDIFATLKHVLGPIEEYADALNRSHSLFVPISPKRNCEEAFISPHFCTCLSFVQLPVNHDNAIPAAQAVVDKLNEITRNHRNICEIWTLNTITRFTGLVPNKKLHHKTKNVLFVYQIQVDLNPGNAVFESTVYFIKIRNSKKFYINDAEISRINIYGNQARCVEEAFPDLRKYCYCK